MKRFLSAQELREKLPGQDFVTELAAVHQSGQPSKSQRLLYTLSVRGCLEELITVHHFHIEYRVGEKTKTSEWFQTIEEARKIWDNTPVFID
jgi:hypothetical protein